jgi:hypothetical protein
VIGSESSSESRLFWRFVATLEAASYGSPSPIHEAAVLAVATGRDSLFDVVPAGTDGTGLFLAPLIERGRVRDARGREGCGGVRGPGAPVCSGEVPEIRRRPEGLSR